MSFTEIGVKEEGVKFLKWLCVILEDEEGITLLRRHLMLMNHYFNLRENGVKITDLPYLAIILEILASNLDDTPQYDLVLSRCFELLKKPILSDACLEEKGLLIFFSSLGNCFQLVQNSALQFMILDVILSLLTTKENYSKQVPLEARQKAVNESTLPETLVYAMYTVSDGVYLYLLEVMYQLSLLPYFADIFISLNCVDYWIKRISKSTILSEREASIKETTSNLLWSVLRSQDSLNLKNLLSLSPASLSALRDWFRREVMYGKPYERNNVASLILQICLTNPQLKVSHSGIMEDIALLATATEFGLSHTWAAALKFEPTAANLAFKKLLVTILLTMIEDNVTKVNNKSLIKWDHHQRQDLLVCCLVSLPIISKHFNEEYTLCGATSRILELILFFGYQEQNHELLAKCCQCLHLLVSSGIHPKHFRILNVIPILLKLIITLIEKYNLLLIIQLILSFCLCIITQLVEGDKESLEIHAKVMQEVSMLILGRLQSHHILDSKITNSPLRYYWKKGLSAKVMAEEICAVEGESVVQQRFGLGSSVRGTPAYKISLDQVTLLQLMMANYSTNLLISACDFVWQCTITNNVPRLYFINSFGIYFVLDIMEEADFVVQLIFLGMLTDICADERSIPYTTTWRGRSGTNNILTLLCEIWKKQEEIKSVSRDSYGCIEDIETCLMGRNQKEPKLTDNFRSVALMDMIGCARPKIAALVNMITKRHCKISQLARSVYMVPYDSVSGTNQITLLIIKYYEELKEGEMFQEIKRAIDTRGISLLSINLHVLHQLIIRQLAYASEIQKQQKDIVLSILQKELDKENELYDQIREIKLTNALKEVLMEDSCVSSKYMNMKFAKYEIIFREMEKRLYEKNTTNIYKTFIQPRHFILIRSGRDVHIISTVTSRKRRSIY